MTIETSKINHQVAERYSTASKVRAVTVRMGATTEPEWQTAYEREIPYHQRNIINQRCFEADHRVELGAVDSEAPFLMDHHLKNAQSIGSNVIGQIFLETRMNLPGGTKLKSVHSRLRAIPQKIRERVDPAMYIAKKEVDPDGEFAAEYVRLQEHYEQALDAVMHRHEVALSTSSPTSSAKKRLRDETIRELERVTRAHWADILDWIEQSQYYLTGKSISIMNQPLATETM